SASMKQLFREIERVARRDTTVLVRGESGTGKELVARAIHAASPRHGGPFRAINCAALPPHLLESELFGHVRGAFTGAVKDAPGHFRIAHGGTLFLDEVADLPLELQGKLLRVLQERTVIPVGGSSPIKVDVRIVSATHTSLREAVRQGRFRQDLMYRLRVIPLFLPPLRDRDGDIEVLAKHVLSNFADEHREVTALSSDALALLEQHDWPGNVRELANVMEYAFAMGDGSVITAAQLPPELNDTERVPVPNVPREIEGETLSADQVALLRALERAAGHRGRAAASLGVSRSTLWRRLKEIELLSGSATDS
ncbi:MAG: transcriptional regulator with PAS, ATPase and Fis domain, partial [Polyangiales bacterium]